MRVISRLNIGGPAIQAITLTQRLSEHGYATTLVRGQEGPDEGNMDHLAEELGVQPLLVPSLKRNPGWHDLVAVLALVRIIRRERPHIVHTHAAKGGTLGRVATLIAHPWKGRRPALIHTYHGHSLTGYFPPRTAAIYRAIERLLARSTDRLIAVSAEVRDELVAMGVAPVSQFEVVSLGFDLSPFTLGGPARAQARAALRAELGILPEARVVTLVARLVPIKRVDRFLRIANTLHDLDQIRYLIVGDGELRDELRGSSDARRLGDRLIWAGFRQDMPSVYFASDVVVLTSDNEGTPVSLIEAQAAGLPVVSTRVGGAAHVVGDEQSGLSLASATDETAISTAIEALLSDGVRAASLGAAGRGRVLRLFEIKQLINRLEGLYRSLVTPRPGGS